MYRDVLHAFMSRPRALRFPCFFQFFSSSYFRPCAFRVSEVDAPAAPALDDAHSIKNKK